MPEWVKAVLALIVPIFVAVWAYGKLEQRVVSLEAFQEARNAIAKEYRETQRTIEVHDWRLKELEGKE